MHKYQKYVNLLFGIGAAVVWFLSKHYIEEFIPTVAMFRKSDGLAMVVRHATPIILGLATFIILRRNVKTHEFVQDSVGELALVTWPTSKETRLGTIVVIVTVILAGLVLGLIDFGFVNLVKTIINL